VSRLGDLVARWREGRDRLDERRDARDRPPEDAEPDLDHLDGREIRVKAPTHESAGELVDILRKHGVACELRRPKGSEVEIACPDEATRGDAMRSVVDGVGLWLLLEDTPDTVDIRCGRRTFRADRPETADALPPEA
jgi:hypothetical protein